MGSVSFRKTEIKDQQTFKEEVTEYFRIHAHVEQGRKRQHSKSKKGGTYWAMALRSDLYRTGMCQSEMLLTEKQQSPPLIEPPDLKVCLLRCPEVCGYWHWVRGSRMSSGRQVLYFCSDIFNMVGFHLCTFHLIFARWLPQIQIPLTSVMNKKKTKELSFIQGRKNFQDFPPDLPLHLIGPNWVTWSSSEERLEKYLDKKE